MTDPTYAPRTVECRWCKHVEPLSSDGIARMRRHTRKEHPALVAAMRERIVKGSPAGDGTEAPNA